MNEFMMDISEIGTEDAAFTIVDVFIESVLQEKGLKMGLVTDFLAQCLNNLENPKATPKTKFYTVFIIKELSVRDKIAVKLFSQLSKQPLYGYLQELALKVDPRKAIEEKGKGMFPSDKATGNNLMRLVLQSLLKWGEKWPVNKQKKPTRYKQTVDKLIQERVVLPKNFVYYPKKVEKGGSTPAPQNPKQVNKKASYQTTPSNAVPPPSKVKQSKEKYASQIKFMYNKIQSLLGTLEDQDQPEVIEKQVLSYHQKFLKDLEKLHTLQHEILDGQEGAIIDLYFKLIDFFSEEKGLFNLHAQQNDYRSYIQGYKMAFQRTFEASSMKKEGPPFKQEPSIEAKLVQPPKDAKIKSGMPPSPPPTISKVASEKPKPEIEKENVPKKAELDRPPQAKNVEASRIAQACFSKLQKASKSPLRGFKQIASSLSREKQHGVVPRKKNIEAVSNFNKSRFGGSSMAKSTVQLKGIFAHPPNPNLKPRNYEGELVLQESKLQRISEDILRGQGHRRFKMSHFKNKYILYEDQRIQIGYKVTQIYQKVQKFTAMMLFEYFFGNKSGLTMRRVNLNFQGDKESLIYTNPQIIDDVVPPSSQIKLQLLNVPTSIPFGYITIQLSYELEGEPKHVSAYMPNSILQMVTYLAIPQAKYASAWGECIKILKTEPFKLSRHFPPDQLRAFLPNLTENSSYSQFSREGSMTDYELYVAVVVQESFEGVLKVNVRPDLTVVLQVGLTEQEPNCLRNFRFYLQALESVLRQQRV